MKNKDHDYSIYLVVIAICMVVGVFEQCESERHLYDIRQELSGIKHELNLMRYK